MNTPAKINLFLEITGKRADGYHELNNIFFPLPNLCDQVTVTPIESGVPIQFTAEAKQEIPCDSRNLCWKAAELFQAEYRKPFPVSIHLKKNIPVTAGLGGGSSDAAAVLLEMNRLASTPLSEEKLRALALAIGADVPFFLNPVASLGRGVGEQLQPISCQFPYDVLLVPFPFPISAGWAYQHWSRERTGSVPSLADILEALSSGNADGIAALCHNDLEYAILDKFPIIAIIRETLLSCGAVCSHVSGSGPTVYALCKSDCIAECTANFKKQFPEFSVIHG